MKDIIGEEKLAFLATLRTWFNDRGAYVKVVISKDGHTVSFGVPENAPIFDFAWSDEYDE